LRSGSPKRVAASLCLRCLQLSSKRGASRAGSRRGMRMLAPATLGWGPTGAMVRRAGVALLATLTVSVFSISPASAQTTITVESGMGPVGSLDPSVTVTDSCLGATTHATIVPPYSDSGGYWISPIGDSQWDSVDAGSHDCNATYQATFTLPADAISPSLSVTELADTRRMSR
jgi:hypothetical protein